MFSKSILSSISRSCHLVSNVRQVRTLRPTIKVGKERFQLSLDVRHFNKDEIKVKAHSKYVLIEGKQEKSTTQGYVLRQFIRKFKLPEGCTPKKMESNLSPEGILTITAPIQFCDQQIPCEAVIVPISYGPPDQKKKEPEKVEPPKVPKNPCASYLKVKPKKTN